MKHVCKLCNKRYPCGKSLGGHMKTHVAAENSGGGADVDEEENTDRDPHKFSSLCEGGSTDQMMVDDAPGNDSNSAAYGLRHNPKKTWRSVVSSKDGNQEESFVCKECGKSFKSMKAICGHMACHSEKERSVKYVQQDNSWGSGNKKSVMDSQSDTEAAGDQNQRRRRRSKRMRYKNNLAANSTYLVNGSSSVSENEQEQEVGAVTLMMLSKDCRKWGGLNSVLAESSDNNSVVLEARSMTKDLKIGKRVVGVTAAAPYGVCNGYDSLEVEKFKNKKRKSSCVSDDGIAHFQNSDSGYLRNGSEKVNPAFKKLKVKDRSGFEVTDAQFGKNVKRMKSVRVEPLKDFFKEEDYGKADGYSVKRNKAMNNSYSPTNASGSSDVEVPKIHQNRSNKIFRSPTAFGANIANCKRPNGCSSSAYDSGENSVEMDASPDPGSFTKLQEFRTGKEIDQNSSGNVDRSPASKKIKYECPVCFKIFKSGQALGGHKRIHMAGGSGEQAYQTSVVIKQELSEMHDFIDLNLPAPAEDEANGFMA